mmetsp:Transcript_77571/g.222145  ORF Transcript_77571/g.222145 Transcript_77571/m.222145 type:complete len:678 (-) Transcript_77571:125-2158(-)
MQTGVVSQDNGGYGYISTPNSEGGQTEVIVLAAACKGFAGEIPPVGTAVQFSLKIDVETTNLCADNVQPANGEQGSSSAIAAPVAQQWPELQSIFSPQAASAGASACAGAAASTALAWDVGSAWAFAGTSACASASTALVNRASGLAPLPAGPVSASAVAALPGLAAKLPGLAAALGFGGGIGGAGRLAGLVVGGLGALGAAGMAGDDGRAVALAGTQQNGTFHRNCGSFGFIMQDDGVDMFCMPIACKAFGKQFPAIGTRVTYAVVLDEKTGRPRADGVEPEGGGMMITPTWDAAASASALALAMGAEVSGTMKAVCGNYGFITQDTGSDVFVLPQCCPGYNGVLPEVGTRLKYTLTTDSKTGKVRADNVAPEDEGSTSQLTQYLATASTASALGFGEAAGTMSRNEGNFGFIHKEGGSEVFVLPGSCVGFGGALPEIGSYVKFSVVIDEASGQEKAENVFPMANAAQAALQAALPQMQQQDLMRFVSAVATAQQPSTPWLSSKRNGTFERDNGKFGFIMQDDGAEMFVMPCACKSWNKAFPPVGTRVTYDVVSDDRTGRPRAGNVEPERAAYGAALVAKPAPGAAAAQAGPYAGSGKKPKMPKGYVMGTLSRVKDDRFGFITPDDGDGGEMFVVPSGCRAYGGNLPPLGTRVQYRVIPDKESGKVRADDVAPAPA